MYSSHVKKSNSVPIEINKHSSHKFFDHSFKNTLQDSNLLNTHSYKVFKPSEMQFDMELESDTSEKNTAFFESSPLSDKCQVSDKSTLIANQDDDHLFEEEPATQFELEL